VNRRETIVAAMAAAFGGCLLAGCPTTATTTTYIPITGILVRASTLTEGVGCGTAPGQVYKYAALLAYVDDGGLASAPQYSFSGVFDCFADGLFSNLRPDPAGSTTFQLTILAWDQAAFPPALQCDATDAAFTFCPGDSPDVVTANEGTPGWSTTCTASQTLGVSTVASCGPLAPPGGALADSGAGDAALPPASGTDAATDAADAAPDAALPPSGTDAATDASDAADAAGDATE
jgi:hypothetical protein